MALSRQNRDAAPLFGARELCAAAIVALLAIVVAAHRLHHDAALWDPDGAIYLRMTLQDRGLPESRAHQAVDTFMRSTPAFFDPQQKGLYGPRAPQFYLAQFNLFRARALYPALGALLYPKFGTLGFRLLSALAYVLATLVMYGVLRRFVTIPVAVLGAIAFGTAPAVLNGAAAVLTDELALLFWVASLAALFAYLRKANAKWLFVFGAAVLLLAFTRPAVYLPLGAALGAYFAARQSPFRTAAKALVGVSLILTLVYLAYSYVVHAPGLAAQLRWEYSWHQYMHAPFTDHGLVRWWLPTVALSVVKVSVLDIYKNGALLVVVLAIFGAAAAWRSIEVGAILGAAIAALAGIIFNPVDLERTFTVPITPLAIILATMALQRLADVIFSKASPRKDAVTGG